MKRICLIMALFVMSFVSCNPEAEKAAVETREVTDVTSNSAKVVCNVADDGGAEVSSRGVCWGTSGNPTIETASSMGAGSGIGNYESVIVGLESNTTYYVRAYATNEAGISYGEVRNFTTLDGEGDDSGSASDPDGEIAGHGYVDLGLPSGLKWATCNLGAHKPEGYGNYYAWGEISLKAEYYWDNCVTYGEQMSDISGDAKYDAATANWGESWRMPTIKEMEELILNCTWEFIYQNGTKGCKVIGPNGKCIFLPTSGFRDGLSFGYDGYDGYYWGSTPYDNGGNDDCACTLYFHESYLGVEQYGRSYGFTVRPVSE